MEIVFGFISETICSVIVVFAGCTFFAFSFKIMISCCSCFNVSRVAFEKAKLTGKTRGPMTPKKRSQCNYSLNYI
jgi:hypothetical protein